jgi:Flp pilus assembly protein TadB
MDEPERPSARLTGGMAIEEGTAIVLAYVLVSTGVIIIFLVAVSVIVWFVGRLHERRRRERGE